MGAFNKEISKLFSSEKGIAMLIVIGVLTILMVMALSFSFATKVETHSTISFVEGIRYKFLAEAGIARGVTELAYRAAMKNNNNTSANDTWEPDGTTYTGLLGDDSYSVKITDESGKININYLSEISGILMKNLMVNLGVSFDNADVIVDSILDWKDADELTRMHGAESNYYMSLLNPYRAKNDVFDTLEELLLIKGMTRDILYGNATTKGLSNFLTIHSDTDKINLSTALQEVLLAIPGMTPEDAGFIIHRRKTDGIKTMEDLKDILGDRHAIVSQYANIATPNIFTIQAKGYGRKEKHGHIIKATVSIGDNGKCRYFYYKSPSNSEK